MNRLVSLGILLSAFWLVSIGIAAELLPPPLLRDGRPPTPSRNHVPVGASWSDFPASGVQLVSWLPLSRSWLQLLYQGWTYR